MPLDEKAAPALIDHVGWRGTFVTFGVKGGYEAGIKLVENVGLFSHLANIGDTRSLILA